MSNTDKDSVKERLKSVLSGARAASVGTVAEKKKNITTHLGTLAKIMANRYENGFIDAKVLKHLRSLSKATNVKWSDEKIIAEVPADVLTELVTMQETYWQKIVSAWSGICKAVDSVSVVVEKSERDLLFEELKSAIASGKKSLEKELLAKIHDLE